ncbi:rhodanese-like domain-containing protein [Betaproteobacteria bacterium PRO7]|jgi:rhodanese-related sulfurtransferase|nr:rhodanese-like domain-containing protein [Betaproteobacteria bacterium PRO7]
MAACRRVIPPRSRAAGAQNGGVYAYDDSIVSARDAARIIGRPSCRLRSTENELNAPIRSNPAARRTGAEGLRPGESETAADSPDVIFDTATVRRAELDLDYDGAVTPREAWALVQARAAVLIDVRTAEEFKFVGRVPGAVNVPWHGTERGALARFFEGLRPYVLAARPLLLICRSGVRSHAAANAVHAKGIKRVYNVLEGFEGQIDQRRQRGHVDGWRYHGLPWVQD